MPIMALVVRIINSPLLSGMRQAEIATSQTYPTQKAADDLAIHARPYSRGLRHREQWSAATR